MPSVRNSAIPVKMPVVHKRALARGYREFISFISFSNSSRRAR
jgi:hypothetical protein